jgi:ABC-type lipoprotein release transport system permease subunit
MVGFLIGSLATFFGILLGVLFSIYVENIRRYYDSLVWLDEQGKI